MRSGCRAALAQIAALDVSIGAKANTVRGLLRLTALIGLGTAPSARLPSLLKTHPALRVELHVELLAIATNNCRTADEAATAFGVVGYDDRNALVDDPPSRL